MAENEETQAEEEAPKETGSGLRAKLEETLAENKRLKQNELNRAFDAAGLDPTKGLGKAIAKEYDGEASAEAVTAYAKSEYEWEPTAPVDPQVQQIQQGHAQLDQVAETAGSVAQLTPQELLAKAEAEGDVQTSMAIKGQQVAEMLNPQRR